MEQNGGSRGSQGARNTSTSEQETVWSLLTGPTEELSVRSSGRTRQLAQQLSTEEEQNGGNTGSQGAQSSSSGAKPRTRELREDFKDQLSREEEEQDHRRPGGGHYRQQDQNQGYKNPYPHDPPMTLASLKTLSLVMVPVGVSVLMIPT